MSEIAAFPTRRRALTTLGGAVAMACLAARPAWAQNYPARPVRLLVPLAPGSSGDILARRLGQEFTLQMGQPFVIENKAGAGGTIAMAEIAKATPDGYTIGLASQGHLVFNPSLYARPGYDPVRDFAPLGLIGGVSNVLVVAQDSPVRDVADLIARAKAKPGALTYSSGGSGTSHHLSGVLFAQQAGLELLHVPYRGAPAGITAVMSGEVDMGFYNTPTVLAQIRSGKLRALAVTSQERAALLPDVPTMDAAGVKGYLVTTWSGLVAPAGTPAPVLATLSQALARALTKPEVQKTLAEQGIPLVPDHSPEAMARTIADDLRQWPEVIRKSGARVD